MRYFFLLSLCLVSNVSIGQDIDLIAPPVGTYRVDMSNSIRVANLRGLEYSVFSYGHSNSELIDYLAGEHTRKQLEFSEAQTKEFKALQKEYSSAFQKMYADFPELKKKDIPSEARKELNRKVQLVGQKLRKEFSEKAKDILIPQQVSMMSSLRFKQTVQAFGFSYAVSKSQFSKILKTTDAQKKELAKIREESQEAIQKKIAEMKAAAKKEMLKVLDAKQRNKLKELEGEKPANNRL